MTINWANQFFDYVIPRNSSDLKYYKSNLFIYILLKRYTLDNFYEIMINTRVSKQLITRYKQYLAYKKNVTLIQINKAEAWTINVYFDIGFTFSIKSLLLDIPIGILKFYIIEADTFFLLYLKDIDKLNVYFNNLKNILIILTKLVPMIYHFGHLFLL